MKQASASKGGDFTMINFNIPSTLIVGGGASAEIGNQLERIRCKHALIVTDAYMLEGGIVERIAASILEKDIAVSVYSEVVPDPTDENVHAGLEKYGEAGADAVVGLGGGSPMDTAKAIAVLVHNPPPISLYAGYHKITNPGAPLALIPTTAGTGSEVTKVTVITDTQRDVKMMMLDVYLLAKIALVDYEITMSMPATLTAHVGMDTFTHGLEAYVSKKANPISDPIALSCMKLVAENISTAVKEPDNKKAREAMMLAACQGGMAFSNSSVCLVHGMSRPIGAHFHIPHGLSNSVLLYEVTRYSIPGSPERYARAARYIGVANDGDSDEVAAKALPPYIESLNEKLKIPRLRDLLENDRDLYEGKLDAMAQAALDSGSPRNNPLVPSQEEIVDLFRAAW
ncbi:MAG: iron-containing alcohol dehydrogenase [Verrucomicrobiales bacterium]